jgi:regulator of nucleoside diphosphate kinase
MTPPRKGALPAITLRSDDFDALDRLVGDLPGSGPAGLLQQELDRAKVCEPKAMPKNVVTLNRWLQCVASSWCCPRTPISTPGASPSCPMSGRD